MYRYSNRDVIFAFVGYMYGFFPIKYSGHFFKLYNKKKIHYPNVYIIEIKNKRLVLCTI